MHQSGEPIENVLRDDRRHLWHPFAWMPGYLADEPLVITGAEGIYLRGPRGRQYMDGISSMWLNVHGHNRREIGEAITRQLQRFSHVSIFGQTHEPAATLARRLVEVTPEGLNHVFFSDDGATAVEVGLKMACQYAQITGQTKRTKFIALENAYHGDTLGAVAVGDIGHFHHMFRPLLPENLFAPTPSVFHSKLGETPEAVLRGSLDGLERLMDKHANEVCAFVIEPIIQGAAGMHVAVDRYLAGARELCDRFGIPMIADEVFVGFGRTGKLFACEHEGVVPDILCLAKGLTGGTLPLAATLASDRVYEAFLGDDPLTCTFFHGHSYAANPLGCAAALATLELFEKDDTVTHVAQLEKHLHSHAGRFMKLSSAEDVRFKGLLFAVELKGPAGTGHRVCRAAQKRGLLIRPLGNVVYLTPPLVTTDDQLVRMLDILHASIEEAAE